MAAEIVGGIVIGSLPLIADAAHMATDAGGLALALFAIHFARKPVTPQLSAYRDPRSRATSLTEGLNVQGPISRVLSDMLGSLG